MHNSIVKPVSYILVIGSLALTVACEDKVMHGQVADPFGQGIDDVSVEVLGTKYAATTGNDGEYELDYIAGEFQVRFEKDGYTSATKKFSVSQKQSLPVEDVILYPVPNSRGVFYLGEDELRPLPESTISEKSKSGAMSSRHRYYVSGEEPLLLDEGKLQFIDSLVQGRRLATIRRDGLVMDVTYRLTNPDMNYGQFVEHQTVELEGASVVLRTVTLSSGSYAWVRMGDGPILGSFDREPKGNAYLFQVRDTEK